MAKNTVSVNFQDDIINSSMGGKRRYKVINNSDGTISLEDATTYDQVGSNFGAGQMNATNQAVNESADKNKVIQDIEAIRNVTEDGYIAGALALKHVDNSLGGLRFGVNENGEYGYIVTDSEGADTVVPFNNIDNKFKHSKIVYWGTLRVYSITLTFDANDGDLFFVSTTQNNGGSTSTSGVQIIECTSGGVLLSGVNDLNPGSARGAMAIIKATSTSVTIYLTTEYQMHIAIMRCSQNEIN